MSLCTPNLGANESGTQSPVREPVYSGSIVEVPDEGNCGRAIDRGETVRWNGPVRTRMHGGVGLLLPTSITPEQPGSSLRLNLPVASNLSTK